MARRREASDPSLGARPGPPHLGICLGHQLLAAAIGGEVAPMARPETGIGSVDLTPSGAEEALFDGLGSQVQTCEWHGAEVVRMPEGGVLLASNAACAVQGTRVGRHAYGLQFHCEITAATVAEWKTVPAYAASLETVLGPSAIALESDVQVLLPTYASVAALLETNLTKLAKDARGVIGGC